MPAPFWASPIEAVVADLATRPEGLTQIEADEKVRHYGPNRTSDAR